MPIYRDLNDYLMQTYGTTDFSNVQSEIQFVEGPRTVGEIMESATQQLSGGVIVRVEDGTLVQGPTTMSGVGSTAPMVNTVIPQDSSMGSILAALDQFRVAKYGQVAPGMVRRVGGSGIVNEMSGVRPGALPRIVMPPGARRERGWPT